VSFGWAVISAGAENEHLNTRAYEPHGHVFDDNLAGEKADMLDVADYADRLIDGLCFFVIDLIDSGIKLIESPKQSTIIHVVAEALGDSKEIEFLCRLWITAHENDVANGDGFIDSGSIDKLVRADAYDRFPLLIPTAPREAAKSDPEKKPQMQKQKAK